MTQGKRRRVAMAGPRFAEAGPRFATVAKEADEVFHDERYAAWRNTVIGRSGGKCEWSEGGIRCDRAEPRMFADHIVERADGGEPFDIDNGQCLCGRHHTLKTNAEKRKRRERLNSFLLGLSTQQVTADGGDGTPRGGTTGVEADGRAESQREPVRVNGDV